VSRVSIAARVAQAVRAAEVVHGARLLVAVSGGVDSMVLLDVLAALRTRLRLHLHVAHVHHGLRGIAADQDAVFVAAEAARREVGTSVCRLDPRGRPRGESVQMWAREQRRRCLERIADQVGASRIALAHTRDDQAETILLHLLRGTGPRGLRGMCPADPRLLRPLLDVSRAEVESYAAVRSLAFREDASNASDAYLRNRVRHHLVPLLIADYNPRLVESLAGLAALADEDEVALTAQAQPLLSASRPAADPALWLPAADLQAAPAAVVRRVFQEAFRRACGGGPGLMRRHLQALRRLLVREGSVPLPAGCVARREGGEIRIGPRPAPLSRWPRRDRGPGLSEGGEDGEAPVSPGEEIPVPLGEWTPWPALGWRVRVRAVARDALPHGFGHPWRQILSARLLEVPLSLRAWRPGDRFRPLGMAGEKKLQDFFVDAKVPRRDRRRLPILVAGRRIAWVVPHRIAEEFRFTGGGTACLAEVEFLVPYG